MKSVKLGLVLLGITLCSFSNAFAGGHHYPNGAEAFECGMVPPPGLHFVNYIYLYNSSHQNDNDGNEVKLPDNLNIFGEIPRLVYTSKAQLLGANWGAQIFVPILRLSMAGTTRSGLGDIIIDPFILSWHRPCFHAALGLDIYLPTGAYDVTEMLNPGSNFVTWEPIFAFTYIPPNGWSWSMKLHYDINGENNDYINPQTGLSGALKPGQEFHFDYAMGYSPHPKVKLGVAGYYYQQVTDDEIAGISLKDQRSRVFAIGPGVKFSFPEKRLFLEFRPQFEMAARNWFEGTAMWIKLVYSF